MKEESLLTYRIRDLDTNDRPRERLAKVGPEALSNAELLAILLRVGVRGENAVQVGQRLLNTFGGLSGCTARRFRCLPAARNGQGQGGRSRPPSRWEAHDARIAGRAAGCSSSLRCGALVSYEMEDRAGTSVVILLDTRNRVISIERL